MAYSTLAGDRAADAFANAEAKEHYARALQAAARIIPSPEPGAMARLYAKYGTVLKALVEYEGAVAAYQRALELIRQTADRRGEIDILVGLGGMYVRGCLKSSSCCEPTQHQTRHGEVNHRLTALG
jgi:tetratricopeptide (TPR) repeat protein